MANFDKTGDEVRLARLTIELRPVGALQALLVGHIARAMGRLERVNAAEDLDDPAWLKANANAERAFHRSLAEFRRQAAADARAGDAGGSGESSVEGREPRPGAPPADLEGVRAGEPGPGVLRLGRWCCKVCERRGGSLG